MFITTKITIDVLTDEVLECQGYRYDGPVALAKGDSTANAAETAQASFDQTLQSTFASQFGKQSAITSYLTGKLQPGIDNPTGMSADALAAARTSSTDQIAQGTQNAEQALNAKMASSGESQLPSGVGAQLNAALLDSSAAQQATGQNNITLANEQLKQTNYWNSINALNGVAATENPLGYASGATSGSGAVAGLSQAVTASSGPTLGAILGGVATGALGAAGNAGGFGKLFGCWIASRIFNGSLDPRTLAVREYIHGRFASTWYGSIISRLYMRHGLWASNQPILVQLLKPAFNMALESARA
jgi:hypothetical protein